MPKNDNPHSARLYESLAKHTGQDEADRFAELYPLSKSADYAKKHAWAENICGDLENNFDSEMVEKIRMDCACGPETGKITSLKKLYKSSTGPEDFADRANKQNEGFTIRYENGNLYLVYPQCYCSCVKRVDKVISKAWCYCTLGYTKRMFGDILERDVDVRLLESVKTGGEKCVIEIILN